MSEAIAQQDTDTELFGWDPAQGIVSVWAAASGHVLIWRRVAGQLVRETARYRPWLLASTLYDLRLAGVPLRMEAGAANDHNCITVRELDGQPGAYRYLIAARHETQLVQAICAGAGARLGRPVRALHELGNTYYRTGPVEQYLMRSGRVYFRGLHYADLHRLQFDLETTGLNPADSRIFMVAIRDSRGLECTFEAPSPGQEANLIRALCALIRERDPDVLENHHLLGFDLPFLAARATTLNVPLALGRAGAPALLQAGSRRNPFRVAGRELIDTRDAVLRHAFVTGDLHEFGLKAVARYFGVAEPGRVYLDGASIGEQYRRDPEPVRRYALADVAEVDGLSQRLMGAAFALAGMAPRRYEQIASAGPAMGILQPILIRAYLHAGTAIPCQPTDRAGRHTGGALHLFASGVAEHVVKADFASLYPSLMRTYNIGPACDTLGVLVRVTGRLTSLRLAHKADARAAPHGSLAAGHHNAMQAAMKVLINSAYGYLAAGEMALFADRAAANEVTSRGREMLAHVIAALQEQGVALIEADTDGVYFSVPLAWDEAQERALVAEIAAELPDGIRLEYAGRYRAMFSYEVKNYALLHYDGSITVRGSALRSVRAEPFGEQFLHAALKHTMEGDVAGLAALFERTVAALRSRALSVQNVAIQARLTKPVDAYMASRARQREAPYEALLHAGRTHWEIGERIRFYRHHVYGPVLLDTADDAPGRLPEGERQAPDDPTGYDVEHYLRVLVDTYAARLQKAFDPDDWAQLFRVNQQATFWDRPLDRIQPRWIRCTHSVHT